MPRGTRTLVLLAPRDKTFWPLFTTSSEYSDGARDPLDRWSRRVIGGMACQLRGKALFPFGGPPWRPFISWAHRTGRVHSSPVGLLVEESMGLFVSIRGALALRAEIDVPVATRAPCDRCAERPCLTACPVGALGGGSYAVQACRDHLGSRDGTSCLDEGCQVRRACPVSRGWGRGSAQSAFHMRAFRGA